MSTDSSPKQLTYTNGISVSHISKHYGSTQALRDISLWIPSGSVCALFGENGAGKSTLLKLLAGIETPSEGKLYVEGKRYLPRSSVEAMKQGVALVSQELTPCPHLTVGENIVLGGWPKKIRGVTLKRDAYKEAKALLTMFEVEIDPSKTMRDCSVGETQLIEILRAVNHHPSVMLLDEPTAALNAKEAEKVLELVQRLAADNTTVLLVTHNVGEALGVADQVAVLRGGSLVLDSNRVEVDRDTVIESMLGRRLMPAIPTGRDRSESMALAIQNWTRNGIEPISDVTLSVRIGEVAGLYGLRGSGIDTVARVFGGTIQLDSGETRVGSSKPLPMAFQSPSDRERRGIRFIPGDRAREGLALGLSVATNLLYPSKFMSTHGRFMRNLSQERAIVRQLVSKYTISGQTSLPVRHLSGGNQQKVLLASRLASRCTAVVVHEPTRGIDIGAREAVNAAIRDITSNESGVLVISADIDEVIEVCSRVYVIRGGCIVNEVRDSEITFERLLALAAVD